MAAFAELGRDIEDCLPAGRHHIDRWRAAGSREGASILEDLHHHLSRNSCSSGPFHGLYGSLLRDLQGLLLQLLLRLLVAILAQAVLAKMRL